MASEAFSLSCRRSPELQGNRIIDPWPRLSGVRHNKHESLITGELKSRVDRIWDSIWAGGIANPISVTKQLTCLLFIKHLVELHRLRERKAARTGAPIVGPIFRRDQNGLRWSRFRETAADQRGRW